MSSRSQHRLHFPVHHASRKASDAGTGNMSEKKPYVAYHKPIHSSSLHSIDSKGSSTFSKRTVHPETSAGRLTRDYFELVASILMLGLPVPFFVLAFYAAHVNGRDIEEDQWQSLQLCMKISVTAFPIFFAAIAGRAVKKFASWRLEDGAHIGHLEQLMGSTSLSGTIASILSLRLCNILTPTLLLMWMLSPLGGQSSLHLITPGTRSTFSNVSITYYDTRSQSIFAQGSQSSGVFLPTTNAVFQASIMEPSSATTSTRDLWSNVKIPTLESVITPKSPQSFAWTNITSAQNITYTSLVGIPISGLPPSGETRLILETSYLTLTQMDNPADTKNLNGFSNTVNDTSITNLANNTWHWAFPSPNMGGLLIALDGFNAADGAFSIDYDIYDRYSPSAESESPPPARRLALVSTNFAFQRFYTLTTTYISTLVTCTAAANLSPPLCTATAIRPSPLPHLPATLTNLAYSDTWSLFAASMISSVALSQQGMPTITEAYLNDPTSVASTSILFGNIAYNLTATDSQLRTRAQQLLNTYWQASVNPAISIAGLAEAHSSTPNPNPDVGNLQTLRSTGTHTHTTAIYIVNFPWFIVFTTTSITMLLLSTLSLFIDILLRGPEVLGYCTSVLRDSVFVGAGRGVGSAMGSAERARRWKDVRVWLGDVKAGEEVGYIAVAVADAEERDGVDVRKLMEGGKDRVYA